jgi:glycosyltransferase involved in cell wall biosynthesis
VGKDPSKKLKDLSDGKNIIVTGYVDDPIPFYQSCDIAVVPLRAGGGTRLKILEAMALGRPVVSTNIGSEGLELVDGQHILIADKPEEFADKTIRLLTDDLLYHRIVQQARNLVEERYSWDQISKNLLKVYSDLESESGQAHRVKIT